MTYPEPDPPKATGQPGPDVQLGHIENVNVEAACECLWVLSGFRGLGVRELGI